MAAGDLELSKLTRAWDRSQFKCGRSELDDWLRRYAMQSQEADLARTFVLLEESETPGIKRIIGYFSLTMSSVRRDEVPDELARRVPRHPIGVVLLARLAVDESAQGRGLGKDLLNLALRRAVQAGDIVAARLIVVDALDDEAESFYRRYGFQSLPDVPRRLFLRMQDVMASFE
ncbi:N-acetyltransferase [Actinoplanes sp. OR16]|uniref:GNAT family N-acetyltransferase n=1 Tax=Actinoplanes sp. OR16 TaxID=946334 RepID=UPI000F717FD2|nr:GNAT family N-acetyltransferase [Actinoplanes sp. OR16]BBH70761.1 N-acetyltransferase [Actinoplanes sp. OR16]